ncbi:Uncharacterised protein [Mycobacteroides abscessus subsp. abscessus]|nr:Uncharacterised protein [Mycobacteroides abscessus subsp. abscessus]
MTRFTATGTGDLTGSRPVTRSTTTSAITCPRLRPTPAATADAASRASAWRTN